MNTFLSLFSDNIKSVYTSYDRVILRGYLLWMFAPGNIINFLKSKGFKKYTNGVMRIFTDQLNAHIEQYASKLNVPIIWWPSVNDKKNKKGKKRKKSKKENNKKKDSKLEYVLKTFGKKIKKRKGNFVICIIADMESAFTYATRQILKSDGIPFDMMYSCRKFVKHYYIYFYDELLGGPCYLKIDTYFPFPVEFYFNGHNAIQVELDNLGFKYRKDGNAFTMIPDSKAVNKIAWSLTGMQVFKRIKYWMSRFFRFSKGKYSTCPKEFCHEWYCHQIEICTNIIFKSSVFCTKLFERLIDKFIRIGSPDSLSQIFGKRRKRKDSKSTWRLYDNKACLKNWFKTNSIKFYNKLGYYLRIETTINDPKSLGLKKPLINLREYLTFGDKSNRRMMESFSDVDIKTISNGETDKLNESYEKANGQKVSAVDLRKKRQIALFKELLKPQYLTFGFQTSILLANLSEFFQNIGQIRYELQKLRVHGLIEKKKNKSFYMVTRKGYEIIWLKISSNLYFENPMLAAILNNSETQVVSQPTKLEDAYKQIDEALSTITQELCIKKAA